MTRWALLTAGLLLLATGTPAPGQERQIRQQDRVRPQMEQDESESEADEGSGYGTEESLAVGYACGVSLLGGVAPPHVMLGLASRSDCGGRFGTYQFRAFGDNPWDARDLPGIFRALDELQGRMVMVVFLPNLQRPNDGLALEIRTRSGGWSLVGVNP
jgi:hypothetical protein